MQTKLEQGLARLKELNSNLSKRNRILLLASAAVILAAVVGGALLLNSSDTAPLFVDLPQQEAAEIMGKLQEMGVDATYSGGTIYVPIDQTDTLRAQLVLQGYPRGGLSYEVFRGNVGAMTTELEKETYKLYDLQDRLAATIRYFDGVQNAVVTISTGSESRYVLERDRQEPSAHVVVVMQSGRTFTPEQAQGVQRLVASAIPGMRMENVLVLDETSRDLTIAQTADDPTSGTVRLKLALERDMERSIQSSVYNLLSSIYGPENVRVAVKCVVDVRRKLEELIEYRPSTSPGNPDNNTGVVERESHFVEAVGPGEVVGGVPATETNAVIPIYPNITSDGNEIYYTNDVAFEYLVTQFTQQIQDEGGDLLDTTVGVVLDGGDQMSRTERDELRRVVAAAAGIPLDMAEEKVAVLDASFADAPRRSSGNVLLDLFRDNPWLQWILIGALLLLIIVIGAVKALVKKMKQRKLDKAEAELLAAARAEDEERARQEAEERARRALEEEELEDLRIPLDQMRRTREMELKEQIGEFSEMNPEIAAQLIKTWLRGGDD